MGGVSLAVLATLAADPVLGTRLDPAFAAATASGFAGELLVGDANGHVLYERAAGLADRERNKAHRTGQLWRWASVTKQVTAALVMAEVDAGRLSLEDTAGKFLPPFAAAGRDPITVRQLLQHMSGLPNPTPKGAEEGNSIPPFYARTGRDVGGTRDALGFCAGPREAKPGAGFVYNNCDYLVLGAILERVTGKSYPELVRSRLARPYGLRSLSVARAGRPGVRGYDEVNGAELPYNLGTFGAGGALVGTGRDLISSTPLFSAAASWRPPRPRSCGGASPSSASRRWALGAFRPR